MSLADKIAYARARNLHVPGSTDEASAAKTNVWGRSVRRTDGATSSDAGYTLTRSARECPDEPAYLDIDFAAGLPVRVNAIEMPLIEMIESLEIIAGAHGVGRIERFESGADGVATQVSAEAPTAIVLYASHRALERIVIPPDLERLKEDLACVYADLVYQERWASPTREAIDAFVRTIQPRVTGSVRLKLFKGECEVLEVRSPHAIEGDSAVADAGGRFEPAPEGLTS
jgi:argininosuccinate synthase